MFFDTDAPPVPTSKVRRDYSAEIEALRREVAEAKAIAKSGGGEGSGVAPRSGHIVESAKTWEEGEKLLPKTPDGDVDWTEALTRGVIAPRPGPDPQTPAEAVLSFDVVRIPAEGESMKVVFPHRIHTILLACSSCHPALFEMRKGATRMSMDQINNGEGCGFCHGKVAFPATACARCHPGMGG